MDAKETGKEKQFEDGSKKDDNTSTGLKCVDYKIFDVEAEIPIFTIKRNNQNDFLIKQNKDYDMNVPLLIKHILDIKLGDNFGQPISAFGICFRTVMIYGRAVPLGIRSKNDVRLYSVDDGTGSIVVHYPHSGKKENMDILSSVNKLQHELDLAKRYGLPSFDCYNKKTRSKNCGELIKSMDIIIKKIKKHTYFPETFFQHGVKVSVVGIPYKINRTGEIHIYAQEMIEDNGQSRDKELFFKRNLFRFYKNNLSILQNVNSLL